MIASKRQLAITEGPIFGKMISFAMPVMLSGILQTLYSMADNVVVGKFSGDPNALGAVGSTGSLSTMLLNLIIGISLGASVATSQAYGAKNEGLVSRTVHTAITFALIGGIAVMAIGLLISKPVLVLMGTRPALLKGAVLYFRIICLGIPATSLYNFAADILRSVGNSRTPLIILTCTGIANVALNFLFVCGLGMSVEGVAIATITSQYLSAACALLVLWRNRDKCYGFTPKKMCLDVAPIKRMLRLGIPAALQNMAFSLSNIMLISGVNSLGDHAIKANTIAGQVDAITYTASTSFGSAAMVFTGQNYGAKKYSRIKRVLIYGLVQATVFGVLTGQLFLIFSEPIANMFISSTDPNRAEILALTKELVNILLNIYFVCGVMGIVSSVLKGLGYSISPMITALVCICGTRITWRYFVFPHERFNSLGGLYLSFPISWIIATVCYLIIFFVAWRKIKRKKEE